MPVSSDTTYIGTSAGIYFYNGKNTHKLTSALSGVGILDGDNNLWAGDLGRILKIKGLTIVDFNYQEELSEIEFPIFGADGDGNVWVTESEFLGRLDRTYLAYPNLIKTNSQNRSIRAFLQDKKGDFYFGTYFDGLLHYDGKNLTNYSFVSGEVRNYGTINNIMTIAEDISGKIWIFSPNRGDLRMFDGKDFHLYHINENEINSIYPDSKGNIWFADHNNKLLCYFNGKEKVCYGTAQGLSGGIISSIYEDYKGVLWVGTSKGLNRLQDDVFTYFTEEDGIPDSFITALSGDSYGNLWIGTPQGLSRFDGKQFTNISVQDGLKDNQVQKIVHDEANRLIWVYTLGGLLAVRQDTTAPKGIVFEDFSEAEGFSVPETYLFYPDQQGNIWFSKGNSSLYKFDYKKLKAIGKPFPIHISNILINNQNVLWSQFNDSYSSDSLILQTESTYRFGDKQNSEKDKIQNNYLKNITYDSLLAYEFIPLGLKLPFSANSISFEFAAIDPHFSKNTRYQYYLEGFDNDWSPLEKNNIARFGNLHEGDYTLRIKALNPYGFWSEMDYAFSVLPPWWRSKLAYLIYILLFGFLGWRIHLIQKARTLRKEREKTKDKELAQAKEIEKAYGELGKAHQTLKSTQAQLIQSEKMASLGELTAGIAHEIQNPLNFVNNFSEVSSELLDEMNEELEKGDIDEAKFIANDIKQNLDKINHHGKRADAIVKGMLEHSRISSGEKVPTDINALAEEYLRLSYHGMRAKDKSFNADFVTDFDQTLPKINLVPQEIGRVLLNIINNAFQACVESFQPLVQVSTKNLGDKIEITVSDNGPGIPDAIKTKIFQPFFTTKPTGQGTGLGLSLSYDIVKAHGGEIKVDSQPGLGTTFYILLPIH